MKIQSEDFKYQDIFKSYLDEIGVSTDKVCLVGSIALSVRDVREHGDLDFCVHSDVRDVVKNSETPEKIGFHEEKYANIDVTCDELIEQDEYHNKVGEFKIARLELEFSHKLHRDWEKDRVDIRNMEQLVVNDPDWDWNVVTIPPSAPQQQFFERLYNSVKNRGFYQTVLYMLDYFKPEGTAEWLDRYKHPLRNVRMSGMINEELNAHASIGDLLSQQYDNGTFSRWDLVQAYALANEHGPESLSDISSTASHSIRALCNPPEKLLPLEHADPSVTISPNMGLVDNSLFVPIYSYYGYDTIPVTLDGDSDPTTYPSVDFSFDDSTLEQYYYELLLKHGTLFFSVLWPNEAGDHDELEAAIADRFTIRNSVDVSVETENQLRELARSIYSVQGEFSWYTREWVSEKLSQDGDRVRVIVFEVPNPTYDRSISLKNEVAIEVRSFKRNVRSQYDTKRVIHATDNSHHNRQLVDVFMQSDLEGTDQIVTPNNTVHFPDRRPF